MVGVNTYNQGLYADEAVAKQWIAWVEDLQGDVLRNRDVYPWLKGWIKKLSPKRILETGSGQGVCSSQLGTALIEYIGVEPSEHLRARAGQLYPDRTFLAGRVEELPLPDTSVDAAFSVFVWFHLADLERPSAELARVLRKGGAFAIITANPAAYDTWLLWQKNVERDGKLVKGSFKRFANHEMYLHTLEEMKQTLMEYGLHVEEVTPCGDRIDLNEETQLSTQSEGATTGIIISGTKA